MNIKNNVIRPAWHSIRNYILSKRYKNLSSKSIDYSKPLVVFVSHSSIKGGAPLLGLHIITKLKESGYEVFSVVLEPGELLPYFYDASPCCLCLTQKSFEANIGKLSNIHFAICNSAMTGKYISLLKNRDIRIVSLIHELPNVLTTMNGINKAKSLLNYSDRVIFPSYMVKKQVLSFLNYCDSDNKCVVRPQGVYLKHKDTSTKMTARDLLQNKYNICLRKKTILNVASTSSRKGFDIFVKMAKGNPEYQFIWVGVKKNAYYKSVINSIGGEIPPNFYEVGYVNDPAELFNFYYAADAFTLTSREEPLGSVVLEAFSAGLPVFAFDGCGGFVDIIEDGRTGFLANTVDEISMMDRVKYYFELPSTDQDRIKKNCIECSEQYNFTNYVHFITDCVSE